MGTLWPGVSWGNSPASRNTNGHLVITGETNAQLSFSCLVVWGHCGTLGSVNSIYETWTVLLQVTNLYQTRLKCLSNARHPSVDSLGSNRHVKAAVSFAFFAVCTYIMYHLPVWVIWLLSPNKHFCCHG